jgi:capsular polysaccharide biosynthesis protein
MSVDLESRGQGEHFGVLDSADLPQTPSFPVWWEFALGGLAVGLIVGVAAAAFLEMRDKAIRDERDVEFYLKLPSLALVPYIGGGSSPRGKLNFLKRKPKHPELQAAATAK